MRRLHLRNLTLGALVASCFIQIGAQLFALVVIAGTVTEAPPRSFAMFEGEYGYDSRAFWNTVPAITFMLFLVALIANWKTPRRSLLLLALSLFLVAGVLAGVLLEPVFDEMIAVGYRDAVDPALQRRAATWYAFDWMVWVVGLFAGAALLLALMRPHVTSLVEIDQFDGRRGEAHGQ
jgi:hypothetical protein